MEKIKIFKSINYGWASPAQWELYGYDSKGYKYKFSVRFRNENFYFSMDKTNKLIPQDILNNFPIFDIKFIDHEDFMDNNEMEKILQNVLDFSKARHFEGHYGFPEMTKEI